MKKINSIFDFNNLHINESVFVIGNGDDLLNINVDNIKRIEKFPSIGTNLSPLIIDSPYYITGHICHLLFTEHYSKNIPVKLLQGPPKGISSGYIHIAKRVKETEHTKLVNKLTNNSFLIGAENIAFSSMNLAYVMGASEIIFLGIDMISPNHFYDDSILNLKVKKMIKELKILYKNNIAVIQDLTDFEDINIAKTSKTLYIREYKRNLKNFRNAFNIFRKNGTEPITIHKDGILYEAGATFKNINEIL